MKQQQQKEQSKMMPPSSKDTKKKKIKTVRGVKETADKQLPQPVEEKEQKGLPTSTKRLAPPSAKTSKDTLRKQQKQQQFIPKGAVTDEEEEEHFKKLQAEMAKRKKGKVYAKTTRAMFDSQVALEKETRDELLGTKRGKKKLEEEPASKEQTASTKKKKKKKKKALSACEGNSRIMKITNDEKVKSPESAAHAFEVSDEIQKKMKSGSTIKNCIIGSKRDINLRVDENPQQDQLPPPDELMRNLEVEKKKEKEKKDVSNGAEQKENAVDPSEKMLEMMDQMTPPDMTPQQLLDNIIQFGKEQEKEQREGSGFVRGAFDMAKVLLREAKQRKEEMKLEKQLQQEQPKRAVEEKKEEINIAHALPQVKIVEKKEEKTTSIATNTPSPTTETSKSLSSPKEPMTSTANTKEQESDELKSMFAAGEELADILSAQKGTSSPFTAQENAMVDELLETESGISGYARKLDNELVELEVSLKETPAGELDGPRKYPMFDPLSPPETYNPNVDPETAVNWPGALPGTKHVRLPLELEEAVQNAKAAVEVLQEVERKVETDPDGGNVTKYMWKSTEIPVEQMIKMRDLANEAKRIGIIDDPLVLKRERRKLQFLLDEIWIQDDDRIKEIIVHHKDLMLSDYFVKIVKERMELMARRDLNAIKNGEVTKEDMEAMWKGERRETEMQKRHSRERYLLGKLVAYAQVLLKEAYALGAAVEAEQLQLIRSICQVAMNPAYKTEEETAEALSAAVRDMRPLFDNTFVAYMKYAVPEEEGRLARAGKLDNPEAARWLYILKIVQQGVYHEIAKSINRYLEHIWVVLRMKTPAMRRELLGRIIDDLPTMDVRPFVQVVDNIASSLGDAVKGDIDPVEIGKWTKKIMQLHHDTHTFLPPERIDRMARDADEWAAKQRKRLERDVKLAKERLENSKKTGHVDLSRMSPDAESFGDGAV
eukprot:CAMPEP_0116869598 /NCGR_PEP_ID=MMETSP0418-20121206/27846_1 /TAXON_ID=1158023 /ORGANISM="Astrosyne radiata, Strain 13vi08-1A" /LENGTH=940 /DNA_ID=CAMNT_0004505707 /DNA_START=239 /DNA_END=3061 /DNA_ORIENTATION=-